ncbi:hypothetical protein E2F48_10170 [Arthrobacter crusticola]|uniref:Uncharacterized protein n=1 Tax=Arthrobacter crusticola TaxID=2547960 RepID=A0A4R5TWU4_9MICC|nr:hypothetical protein [Arthrobacter crusticola]TDK25602.1 hypothetical protein E2F48_10170 [Arthrobacter crusticola]
MAQASGWHGIPPAADRYGPPLQLERPAGPVTESVKAPALWARLCYADGTVRTVKGFAMAWTTDAVRVQWIEHSRAREAWLPADQCTRRELPAPGRFAA